MLGAKMCSETDLKYLEGAHKAVHELRRRFGKYTTYHYKVEDFVTRLHDTLLDLECAAIRLMDRIESREEENEIIRGDEDHYDR